MECNFENCGYYTDGECNICGMGISGEDTFCRFCKDNPNCYYKQNLELKAENDKLKQVNKELAHYLACMTEQRNKANTCLQEIKAIADEDCEFCDDIGGCMDNECRKVRILDLITKAEEE